MEKLQFDPANTFMLLIFVNGFLHYFVPLKQIIDYPISYIGIFLFILGWIPNFLDGLKWGYVHTDYVPEQLVTSGIFRFTRNPTYLGMTAALIGEAVFLGSVVTFIIPILFFAAINLINIPLEEKNLERRFDKKYLDYKKKVRRWI